MTNPKFAFCGYPVQRHGAFGASEPCGAIATPGCAFCDAHANAVVDDLPRRAAIFEKMDRGGVADTGSGFLANPFTGKRLTADDIVDRAERRVRRWQLFADVCIFNVYVFLILLIFLFDPAHAWMHLHADYFIGAAIGTVAQGIAWGTWRWRKGDRP